VLFGANGCWMRFAGVAAYFVQHDQRGAERTTDGGAQEARIDFVAAPVFGGQILPQRALWIVWPARKRLWSGRGRCWSRWRGHLVVGRAAAGACTEAGGNFLISAMIHSMSEAFVYAQDRD